MNHLKDILNNAEYHLHNNNIKAAFNIFGPGLNSFFFDNKERIPELSQIIRNHPAFKLVMQDPYSKRAFDKPRRYAGDAVMLDYIYRGIDKSTSQMGKRVFQGTGLGPMGQSVSFRKMLLKSYINQAVATSLNCSILSVASGHCREVENSLLQHPEYSIDTRFYALDQDKESLTTVKNEYSNLPISTIPANIKSLFNLSDSPISGEKFDLIYSAGLFDYLDDFSAAFLTGILVSHLKVGGKLLIGNFSKGSFGIGFMELFLDWKLQYRAIDDLTRMLPGSVDYRCKTFEDPHGNVVYMEILKNSD